MVVAAAALVSLVVKLFSGGQWPDIFGEAALLGVGIMYYGVRMVAVQFEPTGRTGGSRRTLHAAGPTILGAVAGLLLATIYGTGNAGAADPGSSGQAFLTGFVLTLVVYVPVFLLGMNGIQRVEHPRTQCQAVEEDASLDENRND